MTPSISCRYFHGVAQVYAIGRLHPQQVISDHVRWPAMFHFFFAAMPYSSSRACGVRHSIRS
jgi:hypothetical protein